jgi:hypothetical protein
MTFRVQFTYILSLSLRVIRKHFLAVIKLCNMQWLKNCAITIWIKKTKKNLTSGIPGHGLIHYKSLSNSSSDRYP